MTDEEKPAPADEFEREIAEMKEAGDEFIDSLAAPDQAAEFEAVSAAFREVFDYTREFVLDASKKDDLLRRVFAVAKQKEKDA